MKTKISLRAFSTWLLPGLLLALLSACVSVDTSQRLPGKTAVTVRQVEYHRWPGSYVISNGKVEATVVPAIGRVMQFGFLGEEGVFWENRALDGQSPDWKSEEWINFGGDKTWPAPEADWPNYTKRSGWRPPPAFDAMSLTASVDGADLLLTSPVDPYLGIRTERRVSLDPVHPVMTITTTYERISGEPSMIGVWIITQLKEPAGIYVPVPENSIFPNRYALLGKEPPPDLKFAGGLLSLTRNRKTPHKIGSDGDALVWVGEKHVLRIDSKRVPGAEYADQGSSVEVYTNPDPLPYIELETLGPLHRFKAGDRIHQTNTYTLSQRAGVSPEAEARRVLGR